MSDKPTIVLVHGFWGGAAHWANVITELNKRGYDRIRAVENPLTSLADDAERTRKMVKQVDGPVVLVGHSYGGAVITEAGDLPDVTALVHRPLGLQQRGERGPGNVRRGQPGRRSRRVRVHHGGGVEAAHAARRRDLGAEPLPEVRVARELRARHLHGHRPPAA
ncbi:hypothetical protein SCYAM73S_02892 [Streptomyces cyaneofuscatus]